MRLETGMRSSTGIRRTSTHAGMRMSVSMYESMSLSKGGPDLEVSRGGLLQDLQRGHGAGGRPSLERGLGAIRFRLGGDGVAWEGNLVTPVGKGIIVARTDIEREDGPAGPRSEAGAEVRE